MEERSEEIGCAVERGRQEFLGVAMEHLKFFGQRLKKGRRKFDGHKKIFYRKLGTLFRPHKFFVSLQL